MSDILYSSEKIFSKQDDGILFNASKYYIPAYQRGYKWRSDTDTAPVSLLMSDIKDAYQEGAKEYYLQYITISKHKLNDVEVLEVIDGQQRLTTLSILYSVLSEKLNKISISNNLITFDENLRRNINEFLDMYIYGDIKILLEYSWFEFIEMKPIYNEQDIYHMFNAVNKIYFGLQHYDNKELEDFYTFLSEKVKIILNRVDSKMNLEKVFANLNTNKVELTNAELIKGLLLTKSARELNSRTNKLHYSEIMQLRSSMGKKWDDINTWVNSQEIKKFYFNNSELSPLEQLLLMLGLKCGFKRNKSPKKNDLFNFFQSEIKRGNYSASKYISELNELHNILKDWYKNSEIHNLLGFLLLKKASQFNMRQLVEILNYDKTKLLFFLKDELLGSLPNEYEITYGDNNDEIHNLLFALNVFSKKDKFNFYSFTEQKWSLEHIFPQKPDLLPKVLGKRDIELLNSLIGDFEKKMSNITKDDIAIDTKAIKQKLDSQTCSFDADEKIVIYRLLDPQHLNSLGNMCLLCNSDNSSNSNGMFDYKRHNIVKRISGGSFVPSHTYDVFSKLISNDMNQDLTVWTENDISVHNKYIIEVVNNIRKNNERR